MIDKIKPSNPSPFSIPVSEFKQDEETSSMSWEPPSISLPPFKAKKETLPGESPFLERFKASLKDQFIKPFKKIGSLAVDESTKQLSVKGLALSALLGSLVVPGIILLSPLFLLNALVETTVKKEEVYKSEAEAKQALSGKKQGEYAIVSNKQGHSVYFVGLDTKVVGPVPLQDILKFAKTPGVVIDELIAKQSKVRERDEKIAALMVKNKKTMDAIYQKERPERWYGVKESADEAFRALFSRTPMTPGDFVIFPLMAKEQRWDQSHYGVYIVDSNRMISGPMPLEEAKEIADFLVEDSSRNK